MQPTSPSRITKSAVCRFSVSLLALAGLAAAQDQTPHAWRSVNDPLPASLDQPPAPDVAQNTAPNANPYPDPAQGGNVQINGAPPVGQPGPYAAQPPYNGPAPNYPAPNYNVPARLTIKPGTYVTVRMNQWLSSDRNQQGDTFTATLEQPVVVDGIVVAQRGQTVYGRVSDAQKAGRVEGTSRLGVQLTQLSLVDGNQASIQSQMIDRKGPTSTGRDAAAIGGTTALGAAVGAAADLGRGAAIGAGAGAAAGILGVLLTRGRPTVIYPEQVMTFQIQAPVEIATDRAPGAFAPVNSQQDYAGNPAIATRPPAPAPTPGYGYGPAYGPGYPPAGYPPYAYGYPYPYYGGFSVFIGPRYYRGGFYGYRGFRR